MSLTNIPNSALVNPKWECTANVKRLGAEREDEPRLYRLGIGLTHSPSQYVETANDNYTPPSLHNCS